MTVAVRILVLAALLAVSFSGCVTDPGSAGLGADAREPRPVTFYVVNATTSDPVFMAQVTVRNGTQALAAVSTASNGSARVQVPAEATAYTVTAPGYAPHEETSVFVSDVIVVKLESLSKQVEALSQGPGLRFRAPVDLGSYQYPLAAGTSCDDIREDRDGDCGLGEPQVEVDGRGTIYVSGVCCIGSAPPVYVSRDDGATFQLLETPTGVREAFGIEGDFAIDAHGVVYFADIELAATFQVTAWDADGAFLHHMKWPAPPLVDRDWIRAEGDGQLYYVYNTGTMTNVYTSSDGGATWSPAPVYTAPYGLGNAIKGLGDGELWIIGGSCAGHFCVDYTTDGGATWSQETTTLPAGGNFPVGYFDEAGNLYAVGSAGDTITVAHRSPDGVWHPAVTVSPPTGSHRLPWIAAGGPGKVAVAWYGTLEDEIGAQTPWYLFSVASLDAHLGVNASWQLAIADPEPVFVGALGRDLLDFLQVEIGPDGAVHVAYAKVRGATGNEEQLHYVHSEPTLPLAADQYFWGPR